MVYDLPTPWVIVSASDTVQYEEDDEYSTSNAWEETILYRHKRWYVPSCVLKGTIRLKITLKTTDAGNKCYVYVRYNRSKIIAQLESTSTAGEEKTVDFKVNGGAEIMLCIWTENQDTSVSMKNMKICFDAVNVGNDIDFECGGSSV